MQRGLAGLLTLLLAPLLATAVAQAPAASSGDLIEFELGIHGAVVADSWNPLRLVLRDLPPVEFELRVDQGSLRTGTIPLVYTASLGSSRGLAVFEDEVFIPPWTALSWTLKTAQKTLASGTLDPRLRDDRPLTLLLSREPGRWLGTLPAGARAQEVAAGELPREAAAYSGVAALLIDGTATAPGIEPVVAAAAAGAVVVLVDPLPNSHRELADLFPAELGGRQRLGGGWLMRVPAEDVATALAGHSGFPLHSAALALLSDGEEVEGPSFPRIMVVAASAAYALLVLLLLRFGGQAGVPAALVVAVFTAIAGWLMLRPPEALVEQQRTLVVSTGGLGLSLPTLAVHSLPGGVVLLDSPMRLRERLAYSVGGDGTRLTLQRWQRQLFLGKPALTSGALVWLDGKLGNEGENELRDVLVLGLGPQPPLSPGARREAVASEETPQPEAYGDLLDLLPPGTAVANDGTRYLVALPAPEGSSL